MIPPMITVQNQVSCLDCASGEQIIVVKCMSPSHLIGQLTPPLPILALSAS